MKSTLIYKLWLMIILPGTWIFVLTGCNHLLYPAVREPYLSRKFLVPPPQELVITVPQTKQNPIYTPGIFPPSRK